MNLNELSAACHFGRIRVRLPDQSGAFALAAAAGWYLATEATPTDGWWAESKAFSWAADEAGQCFVDVMAAAFVAGESATAFRAVSETTAWAF